MEKEVMRDTVVRVAYVGNHTAKQDSYDDWNQIDAGLRGIKTKQLTYPCGTPRISPPARFPTVPTATCRSGAKTAGAGPTASPPNWNAAISKGVGFQVMYQMFNTHKAGFARLVLRLVRLPGKFVPARRADSGSQQVHEHVPVQARHRRPAR